MGNYISAVYGAVFIYYVKLSSTVKTKFTKNNQDEMNTREGLLENSNENEINIERKDKNNKIENIISSIKLNVAQIKNEKIPDKKNEYQLLKNSEDCEVNLDKENSDFYKLRNEMREEILDFDEKEGKNCELKEGLINIKYEKEINRNTINSSVDYDPDDVKRKKIDLNKKSFSKNEINYSRDNVTLDIQNEENYDKLKEQILNEKLLN
jgi:hypothetical protein